ncbi:MAG: hypothetical protein HYT46_03455 [Candidatus Vogelbacteria bacterium]|nr:hypothetical protein [Candidatus Vogelbacteria bacterium]
MPFIKNNIAVILAFTIPILLVIGIALSVYWPSFLSTDYDFVYATCDNNGVNRYGNSFTYPRDCNSYLNRLYKVENGKLTAQLSADESYVTHLFLHDSQKNEGREIALAEAQALKLNGLITSPDGVSVENVYGRDVDFFPFFGGSSRSGYYLTKGNKRQKLNLVGEDERNYYYRDNFKFIGWVIPPPKPR